MASSLDLFIHAEDGDSDQWEYRIFSKVKLEVFEYIVETDHSSPSSVIARDLRSRTKAVPPSKQLRIDKDEMYSKTILRSGCTTFGLRWQCSISTLHIWSRCAAHAPGSPPSPTSNNMPDYLFTIFCGTGSLLSILSIYINHKIPENPLSSTILAGWIFIGNFLQFIDSITWASSDSTEWWDGKVYCDITSRIKGGIPIGISGAAIGLCRFLAETTRHVWHESVNKSRNNCIDVSLGLILPLINAALLLIVSPYRYGIKTITGCIGWVDMSWPAIPVYYLWPPVLSVVAAIYAGISLHFLLLT